MRWNRWTRAGFAILAPVLVAVMLAAGEWAQPPASAVFLGIVVASVSALAKQIELKLKVRQRAARRALGLRDGQAPARPRPC